MAQLSHPNVLAFVGAAFDGGLLAAIAVGEAAFLLHPPLPLSGISTGIERGCQQNDSPPTARR